MTAPGSNKGHKVVIVTSCIDEALNSFADVKTGKISPPAGSELQKHIAATDEATVVVVDEVQTVNGG